MIRRGDWAIVVRASGCDGNTRDVGHTFRVRSIAQWYSGECPYCGQVHAAANVALEDETLGWPIVRLQRIGPEQNNKKTAEQAEGVV